MDPSSALREQFVALLGGVHHDEPASLVGIEQEFTVRTASAWPVDFRALLAAGSIDGNAPALDPSDPNARRCRSGAILTVDGREAEVATPPVGVAPGFAAETAAWARTARREVAAVVPDTYAVTGYSTHVSVNVDDRRSPAVGGLYTRTFALGLMLLMDRCTSPGLIVRPRPGRLELCGEFVEGPALQATTAYAVGSALACRDAISGARPIASLPPQLDVQTRPASTRAGWYVGRSAFGVDILTRGRDAPLRRCDGRRTRAQHHLEASWSVARDALRGRAHADDLVAADALVAAESPIPSETQSTLLDAIIEPDVDAPARSPLAGIDVVRARPGFSVVAAASTWKLTVFRIHSLARSRDAYASIPRAHLERFLNLLDAGLLDDVLGGYLATAPAGRAVATTESEPSLGDVAPPVAAIADLERNAQMEARLPAHEARRQKDRRPILPTPIVDASADAEAPAKADESTRKERRGCLSPLVLSIGAALVLVAVVVVVLVVLGSGGGEEKSGSGAGSGSSSGGGTATRATCGAGTGSSQVAFDAIARRCAYIASQLTGARMPYAFERMPFSDATISVSAPSTALVFGPLCAVHDATEQELEAAKDPKTNFVGLSFIGVPIAGLPPGALVEVAMAAPDGAIHTGRGVADARGYAEVRVPINLKGTHKIVSAQYWPGGNASGTPKPIPPTDITPNAQFDAAVPSSRCDRDALLAKVPSQGATADPRASARAAIDDSATALTLLAALAHPGSDLDVRGPWTVDGAQGFIVVRGGDVVFAVHPVEGASGARGRAAPARVGFYGGATVGPSGDGAGDAWQRAFPCGAGQLALVVCPANASAPGSDSYAAVAVVFKTPIPLQPSSDVRYTVTIGGQKYDLVYDSRASSRGVAAWSLRSGDPRARALVRNNAVVLLVPSAAAGDGHYRVDTQVGNENAAQPPSDQDAAVLQSTIPVAAVPGKSPAETLPDFVTALGRALTNGDTAFVRARMHPVVIERYGSAACDAFAAGAHTPVEFSVQSISPPDVYAWSTDGLSRDVPGTNSIQAIAVTNGQSQPVVIHAAFVDGLWRWFTDCGDPLPNAK